MIPLQRFADTSRTLTLEAALDALHPLLGEMFPGQDLPRWGKHEESRMFYLVRDGRGAGIAFRGPPGASLAQRAEFLVALGADLGELFALAPETDAHGREMAPIARFFDDPRHALIGQSFPELSQAWIRHFEWTSLRIHAEQFRFTLALGQLLVDAIEPDGGPFRTALAPALCRAIDPAHQAPTLLPAFLSAYPYPADGPAGDQGFPAFLARLGPPEEAAGRVAQELAACRKEIRGRLGLPSDEPGAFQAQGTPLDAEGRAALDARTAELAAIFRRDPQPPSKVRPQALKIQAAVERHPAFARKDDGPQPFFVALMRIPQKPSGSNLAQGVHRMLRLLDEPDALPETWRENRDYLEGLFRAITG